MRCSHPPDPAEYTLSHMFTLCPVLFTVQELATANAPELGMQTVPSLNIAYTQEKGYVTADVAKAENLTMLNLSGTKFRKMLR